MTYRLQVEMRGRIDIHIVCCGRPDRWALDAVEHWQRRIKTIADINFEYLRHKVPHHLQNALMKYVGGTSIALTRSGELFTTPRWAQLFENLTLLKGEATFLIGGADGLPKRVIEACQHRIALSPITFQHDVALIVLLEQIYRALAINAGLPYHRGEC